MEELQLIIAKTFGVALNPSEMKQLIEWYTENQVTSKNELREVLTKYLFENFNGRPRRLFEEDTSNLEYLLALLNQKNKGK